jgi:glycosyltransferase involved in cell wall biosynthesis
MRDGKSPSAEFIREGVDLGVNNRVGFGHHLWIEAMSDSSQPLVSCLMVTLPVPARLPWLRRSLASYCRQTHPRRELVIVMDQGAEEDRANVVSAVAALARPDIRVIPANRKMNLGGLRNISVQESRGSMICQWDDDDFYHPSRIERQLGGMRAAGCRAGCLQDIMQYFPAERRLYLHNWRLTPAQASPPTLLWDKSLGIEYPEEGPDSHGVEDLFVLMRLRERCEVHGLAGEPHLYLYNSHGGNTTTGDFRQMIRERLAVSRGMVLRREAALRAGLAGHDFGPGVVEVHGSNGLAFSISPDVPQPDGRYR